VLLAARLPMAAYSQRAQFQQANQRNFSQNRKSMSQQAPGSGWGLTRSQVASQVKGESQQVASQDQGESQQVASQVQGESQAAKREDDPAYVNLVVKQQVRRLRYACCPIVCNSRNAGWIRHPFQDQACYENAKSEPSAAAMAHSLSPSDNPNTAH